jgi:hypothetical protein
MLVGLGLGLILDRHIDAERFRILLLWTISGLGLWILARAAYAAWV